MALSIQTQRLHLRELSPVHDAANMLALLNDPGFIAGIADRNVRTEAEAREYLAHWQGAQYASVGFGHYAIELRQGGNFIGTAGLIQRADLTLPDIGYALLSAHHGCGYAEEAARAVMTHARETLGLPGVCGIVSPGNAASVRLLEKLGLRREGEYVMAAEREPLAYYAVSF
ncbi:MAG TPA: GNAT family N-acetyltransferase [Stenotrophomonas sp.]|nr:GNAT family N-acetyltransferase [Stenotrophomonas sp.]